MTKAATALMIFFLASCYEGSDVVLERTEPDPAVQEHPCPGQRVQYECRVLIPSFGLLWTLPNDETLALTAASDIGVPVNSADNNYIAILTGRISDPDSASHFYNSSLLILETVNGSTLTCSGAIAGDPVEESATITLSGRPDPPTDLRYDDTVLIESSVELQWRRPAYTGGMPVVNYTLSANGQTVTITSSDDVVIYTSSSLIYGTVQVTAINSCGQESEPASLTIPTSAPPGPTALSVEVYCDYTCTWNFASFRSRPVIISWLYGEEEVGVVYPGSLEVSVVLEPGAIACPNTTASSTRCSVSITVVMVNYTVSLRLTNDFSSTLTTKTFDSTPLMVEELGDLSVVVTVNSLCCDTSYPVTVTFGTRTITSSGSCEGQWNNTQFIASGDSASFSTDTNTVRLGPDEEYCYKVCGTPEICTTAPSSSDCDECEASEASEGGGLSTGGAVGVAVAITALLSLPVGVAIGVCLSHCITRTSAGREKKAGQLGGAIYEEPSPVETAIPLSDLWPCQNAEYLMECVYILVL